VSIPKWNSCCPVAWGRAALLQAFDEANHSYTMKLARTGHDTPQHAYDPTYCILDYLTDLLKPFAIDKRAAAAAILSIIDGAFSIRMLYGNSNEIPILSPAEAVACTGMNMTSLATSPPMIHINFHHSPTQLLHYRICCPGWRLHFPRYMSSPVQFDRSSGKDSMYGHWIESVVITPHW
jgi:hypothetical protein